jgi:predicted O-linked N-acetylglucosamine transferase (SPINDLY family)
MRFSIDAATPETFLKIRGWDFWRVLKNIRAYIERFEARRHNSWIELSFVIMKSNFKEMEALVFLAKALQVDFLRYYRLAEFEEMNWQIETKNGGTFNYREECVTSFPQQYNQAVENTRKAAEVLGVQISLPAPLPTSASNFRIQD